MSLAADSRSVSFGPLDVVYDERVLAPRAWTLMQSEWAAELADRVPDGAILELCAGAGHIGLAAAASSGRALVQVEVDPFAAQYARLNAARAGLSDMVEVRNAPLTEALRVEERFPLVVADPPYLPTSEVARWPQDPVRAIDGGRDGLDVVRSCLQVCAHHLTPGGVLLLQVAGDAQLAAVDALVAATPELGMTVTDSRRHDPERAVMLLGRGPAGDV